MSQFDNIVFGKKKFSDLLEEIYNNQQKKDKQVTSLINELKPLISDIGDATLVVPLIKEYMYISVKNDDILIKMAALAQRAMQTQTTDGTLTITDEEKDQKANPRFDKFMDKVADSKGVSRPEKIESPHANHFYKTYRILFFIIEQSRTIKCVVYEKWKNRLYVCLNVGF